MTFEDLELGYPEQITTANGKGCGWSGFKNHCSMRLSQALWAAGFPLTSEAYKDPLCALNGHKLATGAEALAKHLEKSLGLAVKGVSKDDIKGKKGIVFFKDIKGFDNGSSGPDSGDHIDLWDGVKAKSGEYFSEAKSVWFWEVN